MALEDRHIFMDGSLVSQRVSQVVEAIRDYSSELDVKWIPPEGRRPDQAAFAIIHSPGNRSPYVVFYVEKEEDFDIRVLYRIIAGDNRNGTMKLSDLEAWEASQKALGRQKYLDAMEEATDIARFVAKTHLNKIRINKDLTINDYGDKTG